MVNLIIAFSLALIPFFCWFNLGDGIRTPKEIASIVSLITIVGVCLCTCTLKPFKNKWLLILLGWCFFTTTIGINIPLFFDKVILQMPSAFIAYKSLFYITLAILSIVCISSIKIDLPKLAKIINIVVILLCLYGIIQALGCDEFFRVADVSTGFVAANIWGITDIGTNGTGFGDLTHRVVATVGNPALLGVFLAICFPFSLFRFKQEGKFSLLLIILITVITHSSTAIVCIVVASLFYSFFINKKIMLILIALCFLGGWAVFVKAPELLNMTGRQEVIKESWKVLYKKPLTGLGLGSFEHLIGENPEVVKNLKGQNWREAHDEYWQGLFEVGLMGLVFYLLSLWSTFTRFLKRVTLETVTLASSIVVVAVASLAYFPLRIGPLAIYAVLIYGFLENKIGENV